MYNSQGLRNLCALYTRAPLYIVQVNIEEIWTPYTTTHHFITSPPIAHHPDSPFFFLFLLILTGQRNAMLSVGERWADTGRCSSSHTIQPQSCFRCPPLGAPPVLTSLLLPPGMGRGGGRHNLLYKQPQTCLEKENPRICMLTHWRSYYIAQPD